jgi:hypothetical protein
MHGTVFGQFEEVRYLDRKLYKATFSLYVINHYLFSSDSFLYFLEGNCSPLFIHSYAPLMRESISQPHLI